MQRDNTTFARKASLRAQALLELENPVILETHGGYGRLFARCYYGIPAGVVFEKNPDKAARLAQQRPTWAVYEADCERALMLGVGSHLAINFVDMDPYGEPWGVLDAFFDGHRPRVAKLVIVVNDDLRQGLRMGLAWKTRSMALTVERLGNRAVHDRYVEVCRTLVEDRAGRSDYRLAKWTAYYCGKAQAMTHYAAVLEHK